MLYSHFVLKEVKLQKLHVCCFWIYPVFFTCLVLEGNSAKTQELLSCCT